MTWMFKIEKGVPLPINTKYNRFVNTFRAMRIGDSFEVKNRKETMAALQAAIRLNLIIKTRKQEGGTFRVWLMALTRKRKRLGNID